MPVNIEDFILRKYCPKLNEIYSSKRKNQSKKTDWFFDIFEGLFAFKKESKNFIKSMLLNNIKSSIKLDKIECNLCDKTELILNEKVEAKIGRSSYICEVDCLIKMRDSYYVVKYFSSYVPFELMEYISAIISKKFFPKAAIIKGFIFIFKKNSAFLEDFQQKEAVFQSTFLTFISDKFFSEEERNYLFEHFNYNRKKISYLAKTINKLEENDFPTFLKRCNKCIFEDFC